MTSSSDWQQFLCTYARSFTTLGDVRPLSLRDFFNLYNGAFVRREERTRQEDDFQKPLVVFVQEASIHLHLLHRSFPASEFASYLNQLVDRYELFVKFLSLVFGFRCGEDCLKEQALRTAAKKVWNEHIFGPFFESTRQLYLQCHRLLRSWFRTDHSQMMRSCSAAQLQEWTEAATQETLGNEDTERTHYVLYLMSSDSQPVQDFAVVLHRLLKVLSLDSCYESLRIDKDLQGVLVQTIADRYSDLFGGELTEKDFVSILEDFTSIVRVEVDMVQRLGLSTTFTGCLLDRLYHTVLERALCFFYPNGGLAEHFVCSNFDKFTWIVMRTKECVDACHLRTSPLTGLCDELKRQVHHQYAGRAGSLTMPELLKVFVNVRLFLLPVCHQLDSRPLHEHCQMASFNDLWSAHANAFLPFVNQVIDDYLRSRQRGCQRHTSSSESDLRHLSESDFYDVVVFLLQQSNDRDIFLDVYKKKQAKRLLASRLTKVSRASQQSGEGFEDFSCDLLLLSRIRESFGFFSSVRNITTMFSDLQLTRVLLESFGSQSPSPTFFEPTVLTTFAWPFSSLVSDETHLQAPRLLSSERDRFSAWFCEHTRGAKKLRWLTKLGKVLLLISEQGPKTVRSQVWVPEAIAWLLVLFNDEEEWSVESLAKALGMSEANVNTYVQVLSSGSGGPRLLFVLPTGKITLASLTGLPKQFSINAPQSSATVASDEKESASEVSTVEARKYQVDAAIVRLMKSRKTLPLTDIVCQTAELCRPLFVPDARFIKSRLEILISLDNIVRDEKRSEVFHYVL